MRIFSRTNRPNWPEIRDLSDFYAEWTLLADGDILQTGIVRDIDIAPQQTGRLKLDYDLSAIPHDNYEFTFVMRPVQAVY